MDTREIVIQWLSKAKDIDAGKSVYVPCNDRNSRKRLLKVFEKELRVMAQIDPVAAASLTIGGLLKEGYHWVIITKKKSTPMVGWIKGDDGSTERVEITTDAERQRRLRLMVLEDHMTDEQISEIEDNLSSEDLHFTASLRKECGLK